MVARDYRGEFGLRPVFCDLAGDVCWGGDPLSVLSGGRQRRDYALNQSINIGEPYVYKPAPGILSWIFPLEDRRMIHGSVLGGYAMLDESARADVATEEPFYESVDSLKRQGMDEGEAERFVSSLPVWSRERAGKAACRLYELFYKVSGWRPELMMENSLRLQQQQQINQSIEDQKKKGVAAVYAFEKERVLLANIRSGDRQAARQILNEMLSTIYMTSPRFVVLRARAVELMSYLTRAAIEDNPLLEPLIERNHRWTEQLILSKDFEQLSQVLMNALDDFTEGIYIHGLNRSNIKVRQALDHIGEHYMEKISLSTIAKEIGLSSCRLAHLVKEHTGRTISQIIQQVRIQHAAILLDRTSRSCAEIAYDVGFGDQSYFTMHFKRATGVTPGRYRKGRVS